MPFFEYELIRKAQKPDIPIFRTF